MSDYADSDFDIDGPPNNDSPYVPMRTETGSALVHVGARLPMPQDAGVDAVQWRVLAEATFPSARTWGAIKLALDYCKVRKLDVFKKPVHIVPMYNSKLRRYVETVWPGISELQTTAARTGEWVGMDDPRWGPFIEETFRGERKKYHSRGSGYDLIPEEVTLTYPDWCAVTVYRWVKGERHPYSLPVFWRETYAKRSPFSAVPNEMWQRRVRSQLLKCALAASLRAAFPEEIGSDYSAEEMWGRTIDEGGTEIPGQDQDAPPPPKQPQEQEPPSPPLRPGFIPPQTDQDWSNGDEKPWLAAAEEKLKNEPDPKKWAALSKQLIAEANAGDLPALAGLAIVQERIKKLPANVQDDLRAAYTAAVTRHNETRPPDFAAYLDDENGNPVRPEPYLDAVSFARAAFDYRQSLLDDDDLVWEFLDRNSAAIDEAQLDPEAAKIIAEMRAYRHGQEEPEASTGAEAPFVRVLPLADRSGGFDWSGYPQQLIDAISRVPRDGLAEWLEVQRETFRDAPLRVAPKAVALLSEWVATYAPEQREVLARVMASLIARPKLKAEPKVEPKPSEEEAAANRYLWRLDELIKANETEPARAQQELRLLEALPQTADMRQRIVAADAQLGRRVNDAFRSVRRAIIGD